MIKSIFAAVAAAPLFAGAAVAGPYVNVEANSVSRVRITLRRPQTLIMGYAGEAGAASWYAQVGPSIVAVDGADTETVLSGKAGASLPVTEALSVYGEISSATGIDDADNGYGTKVGATWSF